MNSDNISQYYSFHCKINAVLMCIRDFQKRSYQFQTYELDYTFGVSEFKINAAYFVCFQEFNLIDRKELAPLQELIEKLATKDR